jgi:Tfp pilus assembly protein PilF
VVRAAGVLACLLTGTSAQACEHWLARLASAAGLVEVQMPASAPWRAATPGEAFCDDVSLRVGDGGSAALELANDTLLRLSAQSAVSIRQQPNAPTPTVQLLRGRGHFLSRTRQRFDVSTPYLNAAIDGTEFLLTAAAQADELTLFEGRVTADGTPLLPGQSLRVTAGGARELRVAVRSRDGLDWALHYPRLLPGPLGEARALLAAGDVTAAAERAGAVAASDDPALRGEALALAAVIAIARGELADAERQSALAVAAAPQRPNPWLACSYARQAAFDLPGARAAAARAAELAPADLPTLRLAELELASGDHRAARHLAQAATTGDHAVLALRTLGFADLQADDALAAQRHFEQASAADPLDPLARLGLGLALIRQNRLAAGRRQMEIAVSLDPGRSLLRSYLAKAYQAEGRSHPAQVELGRARDLDPADPTPWFYQALGLLDDNRPVEARAALEESIKRNDNRAVYRSRLQLDEDLAAREASSGRVYEALGFEQLARREASAALAADPTDFSAHRLLADSYLGLPDHETGRLSELLQAQLWQPLGVLPLQPQARAEDLGIRQGAVSLRSGLDEYTPLFVRDGVSVLGSAVGGGDGLFSDDVMASVLAGPLSISAAQFRYTTDGFRRNANQDIDLYDLFAQWRVTPDTSVQAEARRRREERGDLGLYPFDDVDSPTLRQFRDRDTYRLGLRHDWAPGNSTLLSVQRESVHEGQDFDVDFMMPFGPPMTVSVKSRTDTKPLLAEAQQVVSGPAGRLLLGGGHYRENGNLDVNGFVFDQRTRHHNGYAYGYLGGPAGMQWTLGLAVDAVDADVIHKTRWSPKLGLVWTPDERTTLRAAALRAVKRELIGKGTIEPVQVAGFVQFFDDVIGTRADRYALGLDRRLVDGLDVGIEASWRRLERPYVNGLTGRDSSDDRQQLHRTYAYWTPAPRWALRAEYRYQKGRYGDAFPLLVESGNWGILDLRTHSLPLGVRYSHPSGWLADLAVTGYHQSGDFLITTRDERRQARDTFWLTDARVAYRLPRRLGLLSVGVRNLFDTRVRFQDTDPQNPQLYPDRLLYGSVSLTFN